MYKHSNLEADFTWDMLLPAYWGTWFLILLLWLIMWLPRKWIMWMGTWLGSQIWKRNKKRRHIAEVNIGLCFPDLSETQKYAMLQAHFRCYGIGLMDLGLIMMGTKERIEKYSEVEGFDRLVSPKDGRDVILVTYHTTTLDMCSSSMLADIRLVSMMKRDKNPVLNRFLFRARTRYKNVRLFMRDQSLRGILTGMQEGRVCYLIPDEDFGEGAHTVYAPFFGQPRATLNIVSRLAEKTGAIVLPALCRLNPESGRYTTAVAPALENFPSGDQVADATTLNKAMENLILKSPEQYLWTFRWFKTLQDGMDPYQQTEQAYPVSNGS